MQPGKTYDLSREPLLRWGGKRAAVWCGAAAEAGGRGWVAVMTCVRACLLHVCQAVNRVPRLPAGRRLPAPAHHPLSLCCDSMSVSHPNICTCHKMCVVRIAGPQAEAAAAEARPKGGGSSGTEGGGSSGSGGHQLVPAISGSGGMVQVVSPHEVLQPG